MGTLPIRVSILTARFIRKTLVYAVHAIEIVTRIVLVRNIRTRDSVLRIDDKNHATVTLPPLPGVEIVLDDIEKFTMSRIFFV